MRYDVRIVGRPGVSWTLKPSRAEEVCETQVEQVDRFGGNWHQE